MADERLSNLVVSSADLGDIIRIPDVSKLVQRQAMECTVCGDKAFGYNFGAITCESCKSFYRRHAHKHQEFHCPSDGNCTINQCTRKYCPACRMKKCFEVGMKRPPTVVESGRNAVSSTTAASATAKDAFYTNANHVRAEQNHTKCNAEPQTCTTCVGDKAPSGTTAAPESSPLAHLPAKIRLKRRLEPESSPLPSSSSSCDSQWQPVSNAKMPSVVTVLDPIVENELLAEEQRDAEYLECKRQFDELLLYLTSPWRPDEIAQMDTSIRDMTRTSVHYSELALRRYVRGVRLISDFAELPFATRLYLLRKNLMQQFNIYTTVGANAQLDAWQCVGPDGVTHYYRFDTFIEFGARRGMDFRNFTVQYRHFVSAMREHFPTDMPRIAVILCLLSATLLPQQPANASTEPLSSQAKLQVNRVHDKFVRFLQRYLDIHHSARSSEKLKFCWLALDLAGAVGELNSVVISELLACLSVPSSGANSPVAPGSSSSAAEEPGEVTKLAPLLTETLLRSLGDF